MYDFDRIISREGTNAVKYDALEKEFGRCDLTPLWVADMEFATPDFIMDALRQRLEHPILGYTAEPAEWRTSIVDWQEARHGWKIDPEWLCFIPGIVKGIAFAVNALTDKGDKIIIQPPVYHPFRIVPEELGREVVNNRLIEKCGGGYEMNLEELRWLVCDPKCKMLILSNPHNPAGLVWPRETLREVAKICSSHNVIVISDEIHCDLPLFGNRHIPFAMVSDEAAGCSITFGAPSKTFNMAGLASSFAVVGNEGLRKRLFQWISACELDFPQIFAPLAAVAAFTKGEPWRLELVAYLENNVVRTEEWFREHLPQIEPWRPEASFLIWLDCRKLGLDHGELVSLFTDKARLALNDGEMFGPGGEGFMRLNIGEPWKMLHEALTRLESAVRGLPSKAL